MENFVYETPTKVYFGKEEELNVGKIIAGYAPKKCWFILVVSLPEKVDC